VIRPTVLLIAGATAPTDHYRRALEDVGVTVRLAHDGLDGMRQALRDRPELVVLDFAADEAADVMRARRALRAASIPLLVLAAGQVADADAEGGRRDVSFLAQPVQPERLAAEATAILESRQPARERTGNGAAPG
jgi:DNA-binding response OmpR family regulator